ncbi:hypothetical protein P7K49_021954 [Saguinus oedipus]|uniref:Uncharacterized protein n=1 Tax=Saguinus oedipus TaxID=9490 RepID=A0ABQ9UU69_SAGOE|nr:hypothetical protein P7K49_021954 [Saguinus oedipus]
MSVPAFIDISEEDQVCYGTWREVSLPSLAGLLGLTPAALPHAIPGLACPQSQRGALPSVAGFLVGVGIHF